ncbi:MAG: Eight transrane protein EpsH [Pedosphaera sp.]|jgi:exosortase|nr:Eight transrane protein EpsH [Pedosphaera sp.]
MDQKPDNAEVAVSFQAEFLQCWEQLPNKGLFFSLLAAWLLLFHFLGSCTFGYIDTPSLLNWMYNAYNNGDKSDEHGMYVPILVLVLFWWKRKELLALPNRLWSPGLLLLAAALLLHLVGYVVQQQRISIVALFIGIYALIGLTWGPAWLRSSFFPVFLFVFCIPIATIGEPVTFPLRIMVSEIVVVVSQVLGLNVLREGTQLFNGAHTYAYEVAAACSGLRSTVAIICISTVYGFVAFERKWKRTLIIAAAFPLAVASNVVRMMCIVIAAEAGGQPWGNFVHENWFFSLVPYVPAIIGVLVLGHWLRERQPDVVLPLEAKPA